MKVSLLKFSEKEQENAFSVLVSFLDDKSSIVKTFTMQALTDLAMVNPKIKKKVVPIIKRSFVLGTPAMRSRGKKLLTILEAQPGVAPDAKDGCR